jgi:hypothetical protein
MDARPVVGRGKAVMASSTDRGSDRHADRMPTRAKRAWFDPRFAIGLALVAASAIGVVVLVGAADSSVRVLAARSTLVPGDRVTADDLVSTTVRIASATATYLVAADIPAGGLIVTRVIDSGELVPRSAVGESASERQTSVVVTVSGQLAESIDAGATVDLWASREGDQSTFGPPVVLVSAATVVRLVEKTGLVVDQSAGSVELLVPKNRVAIVLEAIANDDALSVVAVSIPVGG